MGGFLLYIKNHAIVAWFLIYNKREKSNRLLSFIMAGLLVIWIDTEFLAVRAAKHLFKAYMESDFCNSEAIITLICF